MCTKNTKTETIFTKTEMNHEWNVNFPQNSHFGLQHIYSREFSIGWITSETFKLVIWLWCQKENYQVVQPEITNWFTENKLKMIMEKKLLKKNSTSLSTDLIHIFSWFWWISLALTSNCWFFFWRILHSKNQDLLDEPLGEINWNDPIIRM